MPYNKAVMGLVDDEAHAERIVTALRTAGFATEDISALFPDRQGTRDFAHEHHTKAPEGAVTGGSAGGLLGGALGLLLGLGAIVIPGFGPLIAAGPLIGLLAGAGAGAAVGGLAGALIGLGIPEIEAKAYESKIRSGNTLLAVHVNTKEQRAEARRIFSSGGARDIVTLGEKHPRGGGEARVR